MNTKSLFTEALANLDLLDEHNLPDDQPHIEAKEWTIAYNFTFDNNFYDVNLYSHIINKYCEECSFIRDLLEIIDGGKKFAIMLYTWRCCSRAIPQPKSNEQPNRVEIYEKAVEVLSPEVDKLLKFMYFCRKSIERFVFEIKRICSSDKRKPFLNEAYIIILGKVLEMFMGLDELKNMKASIKNDYSAYRRAAQFLKVMHNSEALQESQNLSMFLANHNKIRTTLKHQLEAIEGYEEVFHEIVSTCLNMFENGLFVTPTEKHFLVKIIAFTINLMDGERYNAYKSTSSTSSSVSSNFNSAMVTSSVERQNAVSDSATFSTLASLTGRGNKKSPYHLAFPKLDKCFRQSPKVVTINIGVEGKADMQINPFISYVSSTPNYDASKWPLTNAALSDKRSGGASTSSVGASDATASSVMSSSTSVDSFRNAPAAASTTLDTPFDHETSPTTLNAGAPTQALHPLLLQAREHGSIAAILQQHNPAYRQHCRSLLAELALARETYGALCYELSLHVNRASLCQNQRIMTDAQNREIKDLALRALQLLSHWNCVISETHSWKLMHPTDSNQNKDCPPNAEDYECAIKYNYSTEEKLALIELISMIKGLQSLLSKANPLFREAILRNIYVELQEMVQINVRETLRKAIKNKKEVIKGILLAIRDAAMDPAKTYDSNEDPLYKGKKDNQPDTHFEVKISRKSVSPSHTQMYIVRSLFELLVTDKFGSKKSLKKELDSSFVSCVETFLKTSFSWNHLLNFNSTLNECCNLSWLWYREFYLEMTMGKRVQFPIDMSLPWILINHVLRSKKPAIIESLFYLLDLYNESAQFSLHVLRKRFLYDEIEAEVNLCFDQLVYQLSEQIFHHYKQLAASILLDKRFYAELSAYGTRIAFPPAHRYHTLLQQRHVQLLGRSIDLNYLLNQRITASLHKSLDIAFTLYETGDLTGIMEFETLVAVNKLTHKLLSKHLLLPDFQDMFDENCDTISAAYGRLTLHTASELINDFCPNYCYNATTDRFVRTRELNFTPQTYARRSPSMPAPLPAYVWGSKALSAAFTHVHAPLKSFIGAPHFSALCKFTGYRGVALLIEKLLERCSALINGTLLQHVQTLGRFMPKTSKLLRYDYGSPGILAYYNAQLKDIIQMPDLKTSVLQSFRELGNAVLFALCLEKSLSAAETLDLVQAAPFQNVIPLPAPVPNPALGNGELAMAQQQKYNLLRARYQSQQVAVNVEKLGGSAKQTYIAKENDLLTKERLCCGLSIFEVVLRRLAETLLTSPNAANAWLGLSVNAASAPALCALNVESCKEFHRVWSALQFVSCLPGRQNEYTVEQLFGESLNWAACTLIYLLDQQKRFETLDFSYHLLKVHRVDNSDDKAGGIDLKRMVDRIRKFQVLNGQIFSTLFRHLKSPPSASCHIQNGGVEGGIIRIQDGDSRESRDQTSEYRDAEGSKEDEEVEDRTPAVEHVICYQPPIHEASLLLGSGMNALQTRPTSGPPPPHLHTLPPNPPPPYHF